MEIPPRLRKHAANHPKTIGEFIKEIRCKKKDSVIPIIAEAIEALDIHQEANVIYLTGFIEAKIKKSSETTFLWCLLAIVVVAIGLLGAIYYD